MLSNAEWDDKLGAGGEEEKEERQANEPSIREGEREGGLPASLVPPPFDENEPPFTD